MAYSRWFLSPKNFELAFDRIQRGSNVQYKNFFRHLIGAYQVGREAHLKDLIDDIRSLRYRPSPPKWIYQPKASGVLRPMALLSLRDQVVYQAILNVVAERFRNVQDKFAETRAFGALLSGKHDPFFYRHWKRSYRKYSNTVLQHYRKGWRHVAEFDLVSFYELIDHALLRRMLERRCKTHADELTLLFECLRTWRGDGNTADVAHGVPQGPLPSAFLAEILMFDVDKQRFGDVTYLRYVDDIRLLAKSEQPLRRALVQLDLLSKRLGLVPQAQKIAVRKVSDIGELISTVPSGVDAELREATVSGTTQRRLYRTFMDSQTKVGKAWTIHDITKFKFALLRMNADLRLIPRITGYLIAYPHLSWVLCTYLKKFGRNSVVAANLEKALNVNPVYDAVAANVLDALDVCARKEVSKRLRKLVSSLWGQSVEKTAQLMVSGVSFQARRRSTAQALNLVRQRRNGPFVRSLIYDRVYGSPSLFASYDSGTVDALLEEACGQDEELAVYAAAALLTQNLGNSTKELLKRRQQLNPAVKVMLVGLGLRTRRPAKGGVLEQFFASAERLSPLPSWSFAFKSKAMRLNAESKCVSYQREERGTNVDACLMALDTLNEVLAQGYSTKNKQLHKAYVKAIRKNRAQPDWGQWVHHGTFKTDLPKFSAWAAEIHELRKRSELAHASDAKSGRRTRGVSHRDLTRMQRRRKAAWSELFAKWAALAR